MNTERTLIAVLAAAVLTLPAAGVAQQAPGKTETSKESTKSALPSADRAFVVGAAHGNMAEVELGKLAAEKGTNDAVKQFGQRMVDDHGKANDELKALAQQKGIVPPADLDPTHRKLRDRLSKLSGAQFDRAYMDEMVKDHRKDVTEFRREADRGRDPDVKGWAGKTLPTLQDHLKQAQQVDNQLKGRAAR